MPQFDYFVGNHGEEAQTDAERQWKKILTLEDHRQEIQCRPFDEEDKGDESW